MRPRSVLLISILCLFAYDAVWAKNAMLSPFAPSGDVSNSQIVDAIINTIGPARQQQGIQLCFAEAGADIVTFYTGQRVSTFSVAVRNFQQRNGLDYYLFNPLAAVVEKFSPYNRYMMGLASSTLRSSLSATLCLDDQPDGYRTYKNENLKALWDLYHRDYRGYMGPRPPEHIYNQITYELSRIVPSKDASGFIKHMGREKNLNQALGDWFDEVCDVRLTNLRSLRVVGSELKRLNPDQIIQALDAALESGEVAAIHYDPKVLHGKNPTWLQSYIGFHVSTIMARAEIYGETHYLLRGSAGASCSLSIYNLSLAGRCDRGHIWLTEDEIRNYVTSVAYYADAF